MECVFKKKKTKGVVINCNSFSIILYPLLKI